MLTFLKIHSYNIIFYVFKSIYLPFKICNLSFLKVKVQLPYLDHLLVCF